MGGVGGAGNFVRETNHLLLRRAHAHPHTHAHAHTQTRTRKGGRARKCDRREVGGIDPPDSAALTKLPPHHFHFPYWKFPFPYFLMLSVHIERKSERDVSWSLCTKSKVVTYHDHHEPHQQNPDGGKSSCRSRRGKNSRAKERERESYLLPNLNILLSPGFWC